MKKLLAATLALATLLPAFAACGTSGGDTASQSPSQSEAQVTETTRELTDEEKRALLKDNVPTKDYGGKDYNVLSRVNFAYEFNSELTGDVMDDAIYNRNLTIEDRFNIKIKTITLGDTNNAYDVLKDADAAVMAGDDAYNLVSAYTYRSAPGSLNGCYADLLTLAPLEFSQPWWSQGFVDAVTINNHAYVATGSLSILFHEVTLGVFFNKQLAKDNGINDMYGIVRDGDWTFDKLIELSEKAARDLNGDGKMDEQDCWGIGVNRYTHVDCFQYAFDVPITTRDAKGLPVFSVNCEKMATMTAKLVNFLNTDYAYICNDGTRGFKEGMFENNQGLFMTSWLGNAADLREMDADFGIIPYPKYDKAQEKYQTYYLDRTSSFVIPITTDLNYTASIAEAMACESYKTVVPAFYDTALKSKYARDDDSQEMIDIILEGVVFDFANIFAVSWGTSNSAGQILRELVWKNDPNFSSKWASIQSGAESVLKDLIASFDTASKK